MASPWYRAQTHDASRRHGLDARLVEAIIRTESSGLANAYRFEPAFWGRYLKDHPLYRHRDPKAVSASYGLMQVMYPVAVENGYTGAPEGLYDVSTNLDIGCKYLAALLRWARVPPTVGRDAAIAAYNGGKGVGKGIDLKTGRRRPFRNQQYVDKVLRYYGSILMEPGA